MGFRVSECKGMAAAAIRRAGLLAPLRSPASGYRWASSQAQAPVLHHKDKTKDANKQESAAAAASKAEVVYEGSMAATLRRVKLLSFTTFALSTIGSPMIAFYTYPGVSLIAKSTIATSMIILSASTTAGLHWFAGPYIRKLKWKPGSQEFEVETLSLVSTPVRRTLHVNDVRAPETQRPLVTFCANGKYYYVDEDAFPSSELLNKLVGRKKK